MAQGASDQRVKNLERRVATVEQILPTLATKADLQAAIAPLATRAEVQAAIAPLATKAEVKAEGEQTRRHFDIVAEGLHADIRMLAEGIVSLHARVDAHHAETTGVLAEHDRRLTRLETSRPKRS